MDNNKVKRARRDLKKLCEKSLLRITSGGKYDLNERVMDPDEMEIL